jgi:hypothetical protein
MLKYRVINSKTGEDITEDYDWVVSPNGDLNYLDYGDLVGIAEAKLVIISVDFANDIP